MSSRDTFVTSFFYTDGAADIVAEVMKKYCSEVYNHVDWVSGFGKYIGYSYESIIEACEEALEPLNIEYDWDLVIMCDDEKSVMQRANLEGRFLPDRPNFGKFAITLGGALIRDAQFNTIDQAVAYINERWRNPHMANIKIIDITSV